jgi:hypothetical protein
MLAILPLSAAEAADTHYFKDILRPHGRARSVSAKLADGRSCGALGISFSGDVKKFEQCVSGHGWVVDRHVPDPKAHVSARASDRRHISIRTRG